MIIDAVKRPARFRQVSSFLPTKINFRAECVFIVRIQFEFVVIAQRLIIQFDVPVFMQLIMRAE